MRSTNCRIDGIDYALDYEMTQITSGKLFHGTLFQKHIFEFFFIEFKNGDPLLFSPLNTDKNKVDRIMEAVKKAEATNQDPQQEEDVPVF